VIDTWRVYPGKQLLAAVPTLVPLALKTVMTA
jgi:hypothetical protein